MAKNTKTTTIDPPNPTGKEVVQDTSPTPTPPVTDPEAVRHSPKEHGINPAPKTSDTEIARRENLRQAIQSLHCDNTVIRDGLERILRVRQRDALETFIGVVMRQQDGAHDSTGFKTELQLIAGCIGRSPAVVKQVVDFVAKGTRVPTS